MFLIQILLALLATSQAFTLKVSSTCRNLKCTAVTDVDSQFYNPTDDEFYNMFLRTLSDKSTSFLSFEGDETEKDLIEQKAVLDRMIRIPEKRLVENGVVLLPGTPIEFILNKRLQFGNFISWKSGGKTLLVSLASGREMDISVDQAISSWDLLADESPPNSPEEWAEVARDALDFLSFMSPRKSDLQQFYQLVASQRSTDVPIDSLDLGIYIFQERKFKKWTDPFLSADESDALALSAAQRYAAALLLFYDDFHFKRRPSSSTIAQAEDVADFDDESSVFDLDAYLAHLDEEEEISGENGEGEEVVLILEGGYKLLDQGSVTFKEGEAFLHFYDQKTAGLATDTPSNAPYRAACINRNLRAIEVEYLLLTLMREV